MRDPVYLAELRHDQEQSRSARDIERLLPEALDDVVWRVMRGETYPKVAWPAIDLADFLDGQVEIRELQLAYVHLMVGSSREERSERLEGQRDELERRLRKYLENSEIIRERAADLYEEEREES